MNASATSRWTDPAAIADLLARSGVPAGDVAVGYVRLDPAHSTLVAFSFTIDGESHRGYIRAHPGDRARVLAAKWANLRPTATWIGDGVRLLDDPHAVLFLFPNDAGLRDLRWVTDTKKLKRTLGEIPEIRERGLRVSGKQSTFETLRYKPERRFIVRADLALRRDSERDGETLPVVFRFFPDARGRRLWLRTGALVDAGLDAIVPRPLAALMDDRLYVETAVEGRSVRDCLLAGDARADDVARAMHAFHTSGAALDPDRSTEQWIAELREGTDLLDRRVRAEIGRLATRPPAAVHLGPVHGDMHAAQWLRSDEGVHLVDFERSGNGDPRLDLGRFIAELDVLAMQHPDARPTIEAFRDEFVDESCRLAHYRSTDLGFFVTLGLFDLARLPHRRGRDDADEIAAPILDRAFDEAARWSPRWNAIYPWARGAWTVRLQSGRFARFDPDDRTISDVEPAADERIPALAAHCDRGELVAYRVGRRAVVHAAKTDTFAKLLGPKKARALHAKLVAVQAALAGRDDCPTVPSIVECDLDAGVIELVRVPGHSLRTVLDGPAPLADAIDDALAAVAHRLARFHAIDAAAIGLPIAATSDIVQWTGFVARIDPRLASRMARARDRQPALRRAPATGDRLVHGDLHDANILLHGKSVALLDLDGAGAGDPAEDCGNLVAHFALGAHTPALARTRRDRFLAHYERAGGHLARRDLLDAGARTLFRLAGVYGLRAPSRGRVDFLLAESERWCTAE